MPSPMVIPAQLTVVIEVARGGMVKRTQAGRVDVVGPPSPFNYGSVVGTQAPDGDPWDALVLGPRLRAGQRVERTPLAVYGFLDGGVLDPKIVCGEGPLRPRQRRAVERFFRLYVHLKRGVARMRGQTGRTEALGWLPWTTRAAP